MKARSRPSARSHRGWHQGGVSDIDAYEQPSPHSLNLASESEESNWDHYEFPRIFARHLQHIARRQHVPSSKLRACRSNSSNQKIAGMDEEPKAKKAPIPLGINGWDSASDSSDALRNKQQRPLPRIHSRPTRPLSI
jgi:hypothetical protein